MNAYRLVLAAVVVGLSGCSYDVQTMSAPQLNVYSDYSDRVPSKWALVVETGSIAVVAHSSSPQCSVHSFPLDLTSSFRPSVTATFENITQETDVLDAPIAAEALERGDYAGLIQVRGESLRTQLDFIVGRSTDNVVATVYLDVGLVVDSAAGRVLGGVASGMGRAIGDAGELCGGGASVLAKASEDAIRSVLGEVAERFANAPSIREVATQRARNAQGI